MTKQLYQRNPSFDTVRVSHLFFVQKIKERTTWSVS